MGNSARQGCAKVGIGGPSKAVKQAIFASWHFRDISTEHYVRALQEYADKKVRAKFAALDRQIWPTVEPKLGWALLLEPAIVCVGKPRDGAVPIGFYQPWSDVFLVLDWKADDDKPQIADVELLMGDFVRKKAGKEKKAGKKLRTMRSWTEHDHYGPYAVGMATAESVRAFEALFSDGKRQGKAKGFRAASKSLQDETLLEAMRLGAAKQMLETLGETAPFYDSKNPDSEGALVRRKLAELYLKVLGGKPESVAKEATETPAKTREALETMTAEDWQRFKLVSYASHEQARLLMLSSGDNPDTYLGLKFVQQGETVKLARVDLLGFKAFYESYDSLNSGDK